MHTISSASPNLLVPPPYPVSDRWALFVDIDGTLVNLVAHPDMVRVDAFTRCLLERLQPLLGGALAVLSGRSLSDVDRLLSPLVLPAGALHGLERRDLTGRLVVAAPPADVAAQVGQACRDGAATLKDVWVEEKSGIAFALHFRAAPREGDKVQQLAKKIAANSSGRYMVQLGDRVAELKPVDSDKGTALRALLETPAFQGRVPIMLGDDLTDETAFAATDELGGLAIVVGGRRPTRARYSLAAPRAVIDWLGALTRHLQQIGSS